MEACALLLAPLFLQRQKPMRMLDVVIGQGWMVVALAVGIFYDLFPRTYVEGVGLTAAKVVSEWVVVAILALASLHLHVKRRYISRNTRLLMMLAAVTAIAAEVLLTTYISLDGVVMLLGHLCKFLSYW